MTVEVFKPHSGRGSARQQGRANEAVRLLIEGRSYPVNTLTEDRSAVIDFDGEVERGETLDSTLVAALDGFDLSVPAVWEVVSHSKSRLVLALAGSNPPARMATIDTIIGAVVGGGTLQADDVLAIRQSDRAAAAGTSQNDTGYSDAAPAQNSGLRRRAGAIVFVLLALLLAGFILANFATRAWVVQAHGTIVNAQSVLARAPQPAELVALTVPVGTRAPRGTPIALLRTPTGQVLSVRSPCNCVVGGQLAGDRSAVRLGEPIAQLVPADGANKAVLTIGMDELRKVRVGDRVTATFYDSNTKITGSVDRVSPPKILSGQAVRPANLSGTVEVHFTSRLPAWRVGEPVIARIVLARRNPFA